MIYTDFADLCSMLRSKNAFCKGVTGKYQYWTVANPVAILEQATTQ